MTPSDLLSDFDFHASHTGQALLYARLLLSYLADNVYTAECSNGIPVRDASDFSAWLRELADEARRLAARKLG